MRCLIFGGTDNHPIELWSNEVIDQKLDYIHNNPVEEGLVPTRLTASSGLTDGAKFITDGLQVWKYPKIGLEIPKDRFGNTQR